MPSSVASSSGESPKRRPMTSAADVVIAATQQPHLMAATAASFSPNAVNCEGGRLTPISLIFDSLTFDKRQTRWLKDLERTVESEKKRKRKEWEREVERMREEFLRLYPLDRKWCSDELIVDPLVARRRGSTDILDTRRMKTMFSNNFNEIGSAPNASSTSTLPSVSVASSVHHSPNLSSQGRSESPERWRFRLRFDLCGFDPESVRVTVDPERIIVRASRPEGEKGIRRDYGRKIEKPRDVEPSKIKASLTADGVLVVGATIQPAHSPGRHCTRPLLRGAPGSRGSSQSRSPPVVGSPVAATGPAGSSTADLKPCVPVFRDEIGGQRRLHLMVEVGAMFKPGDVTVQVIKDNRLMIRARHEERNSEYLAKNKFSKEIDLPERIDGQSIRGGFSSGGKLFVTGVVKCPPTTTAGGPAAGGSQTSNAGTVAGVSTFAATSSAYPAVSFDDRDGEVDEEPLGALDVEELLMADAHGIELMPCNVLDLASFPPTAPASAVPTG